MKKNVLLLMIGGVITSGVYAQNVGINQNSPTNSLHVSPINTGDDPVRIDGMQAYASGDTTLMIIDNSNGIVRYVDKGDLGGMIGGILMQDNSFLTNLNNYITNNGGGGSTYTAGTGIGISGTVINNTAPDQVVSLTGAGGTTVTGTYPNFTITSTNDWGLTGNAGTNTATNFLGTTDNVGLIIKTNNVERMRVANGGAVMVNTSTSSGQLTVASGGTTPAIVGSATDASGVVGVNNSTNSVSGYFVNSHATGSGILAVGNNYSPVTLNGGAGGNFNGAVGVYARTDLSTGTAILGVGNNVTTAQSLVSGSGGAFTGNNGLLGLGVASTGTGVYGAGNNSSSFYAYTNGSGGGFTGTQNGVFGIATNTSGTSIGVIGDGSQWGLFANGNSAASGTKSFVIDHPLDPENKILKHFSAESPEVLNIYRGNVVLDANGEGTVQLPDYFTAINKNYSYTLTPIGSPSVMYVVEEIDENGVFKVAGGTPGQKVSWYVYAERNDKTLQVKPQYKEVVIEKDADKKGIYIDPAAYGQPDAQSYYGGVAVSSKKIGVKKH